MNDGKMKHKKPKIRVYTEKDYNSTYAIPLAILKLVGLRLTRNDSPNVRLFWNIFYWFEFVNMAFAIVLEVIKMIKTGAGGSFDDAIEIFRMMPCVGYILLAMTKTYKMVYKRPIFENLVSELRSMWPRGSIAEEDHLIVSTALRHLNYVVKGYSGCNQTLLAFFLVPSYVGVIKQAFGYETTLTLPFFYWLPFDTLTKPFLHMIILIVQSWHSQVTIWCMVCGDVLYCIFLSHITTQLELLSIRIRKLIHVPVDEQLVSTYPLGKYFKLESKTSCIKKSTGHENQDMEQEKELIDIILRHRALIRLSGDVEDMFGFSLLINFFNSSIIICFCGFCCIIVEKWNEIPYKLFLTCALSQTWLLCWYGQRLEESEVTLLQEYMHIYTTVTSFTSEGVSYALYESGWYRTSKKIKSSLLIMLHRTQKNIRIMTTYGFFTISLASFTTIIKSSWSYFTLLLNIYKK